MIFTQTPLDGAFVLDIEPSSDTRGFFSRTVCRVEFARHGLDAAFVQQSVSWNPHKGTLRGLHYQAPPHAEDKLVRVTRGEIFDVIVDLRPQSTTLGKSFNVVLSASNLRQLYVPKGFAHGFQTLVPDTEVFYQMTVSFQPDAAHGIRWDDPELAIEWPAQQSREISKRDQELPLFHARHA